MKNLVLKNLFVGYGKETILYDINFELESSKILGVVGNSGSGKSTLIRCISGQLKPLSGTCIVAGINVRKSPKDVQLRIGYVPEMEQSSLYYEFGPLDNAYFFGKNFGMNKEEIKTNCIKILGILGLGKEEYLNKPIKNLSGGEKKRVSIMIGMINNPDILFLDEPTTGLDPHLRVKVLNFLAKINEIFKTTLVIVSHDLDIIDYCDKVVIFNKGCMVDNGEPSEMVKKLPCDGKAILVKFKSVPPNYDAKFKQLKEVVYFLHVGRDSYKFFIEDINSQERLFKEFEELNLIIRKSYLVNGNFIDYFRVQNIFQYPEKARKIKHNLTSGKGVKSKI